MKNYFLSHFLLDSSLLHKYVQNLLKIYEILITHNTYFKKLSVNFWRSTLEYICKPFHTKFKKMDGTE